MKHSKFNASRRLLRRLNPLRSPVPWANFGSLSLRISAARPILSPPVYVVSMPRSGSSWVGDTLGAAASALYLREPLTQWYALTQRPTNAVMEVPEDRVPNAYRWAADRAFAGCPSFSRKIVRSPMQWSLVGRDRQRLVIKEVNPLALDWISTTYRPRIIYLLRHPAAVANSYASQGWTKARYYQSYGSQTFGEDRERLRPYRGNFWAMQGGFQALLLKRTLRVLDGYADLKVLRYEDICQHPVEAFRGLYDFAELPWNADVEKRIQKRSRSDRPYQAGSYDLNRDSQAMANKWRDQVAPEHIAQIRDAYLDFKPAWYTAEDW